MTITRVTIAIVSYRSSALTIDCLRSIDAERSTTGVCIRAIVVDAASGDAPAIAAAVDTHCWSSWVTLVTAPKNGGFAYGNNLALRLAYKMGPPDYFHMLDPDTVVRRGAISSLVQFLELHPEVGIAGSSFENLDGSSWPIAFNFPSILSEIEGGLQFGLATCFLHRWVVPVEMSAVQQSIDWVPGASMMIRRAVFDAIGGFDENYFLYFEETDFCLRAKKTGFSTWYVPESRVMHIGGQSTTLTDRKAPVRRFPKYWFESRRRYFAVAYGMPLAMTIDLAAFASHALGFLKRRFQRRRDREIPYFLRDLICNSFLWPKNRHLCSLRPLVWRPDLNPE